MTGPIEGGEKLIIVRNLVSLFTKNLRLKPEQIRYDCGDFDEEDKSYFRAQKKALNLGIANYYSNQQPPEKLFRVTDQKVSILWDRYK